MEPQTNTTSGLSAKYILAGVIMLIISSAIGAVLGGKYYPRERASAQPPVSMNYSVPNISYVNTNPTQEVHTITGTVESIKGNSFKLREARHEVLGNTASIRTIIISGDTKIVKGEITADQDEFSARLVAYMKDTEDTKKVQVLSLQPELVKYEVIGPEQVKIGDEVTVTTIENISSQEMLFASKVQVEPKFEKIPPPKK